MRCAATTIRAPDARIADPRSMIPRSTLHVRKMCMLHTAVEKQALQAEILLNARRIFDADEWIKIFSGVLSEFVRIGSGRCITYESPLVVVAGVRAVLLGDSEKSYSALVLAE